MFASSIFLCFCSNWLSLGVEPESPRWAFRSQDAEKGWCSGNWKARCSDCTRRHEDRRLGMSCRKLKTTGVRVLEKETKLTRTRTRALSDPMMKNALRHPPRSCLPMFLYSVYVAYKVSQHNCTYITSGSLTPSSLACLVLSTHSRDPAPCPFQLGHRSSTARPQAAPRLRPSGRRWRCSTGRGWGRDRGRCTSGAPPSASRRPWRTATWRWGAVVWIRFDSIRLDSTPLFRSPVFLESRPCCRSLAEL